MPKKTNLKVCYKLTLKRGTAALTLFFYLATMTGLPGKLQAEPLSLSPTPNAQWTLPPDLGEISEIKFPRTYNSDTPLVVHIQDAHTAYDAQKNISKILAYLREERGLKVFLLEGGSGAADPKTLNVFSDKSLNEKLWRRMMRLGEIGGAEMFLLEDQRSDTSAFGVEAAADYQENLNAYRDVFKNKKSWKKTLDVFGGRFRENIRKASNAELLDFANHWLKFQSEKDAQHLLQLDWIAKQADRYLGVDLRDSRSQTVWPQLVRYAKVQKLNGDYQSEKAVSEFERLEKDFKNADIPEDFWKTLKPRKDFLKIKTGVDSPRKLLESFDLAARPMGFRYKNYPALHPWFALAVLREELDPAVLFQESELLGYLILDRLAQTAEEKESVEYFKEWRLLSRFLDLEVTREEAQSVLAKASEFNPAALFRTLNVSFDEDEVKRLEKAFTAACHFYQVAQARDNQLALNAEKAMREKQVSQAVLVTGGFHTEGIRENLIKQGIGWISIRPRIYSIQDDGNYARIMRGDLPAEFQSLKSPLYLTVDELYGKKDVSTWSLAGIPTAVRHDVVLAATASELLRRDSDLYAGGRLRIKRVGAGIFELSTDLLTRQGVSVKVSGIDTPIRRITLQRGGARSEVRSKAADLERLTQVYFEQKVLLEKAAQVIYSDDHYPLLAEFWESKIKIDKLPDPLRNAFEDYRKAFQAMKEAAFQAAALKPTPAERDKAFTDIKAKKIIPEAMMVEKSEIQRAGVETWSPEHQKLVEQNAGRMAGLLARGSDAVSLTKDLVRRSAPMRLEDFLPQDLAREPQSREMFFDRFKKFGRAEEYRMWAQTTMSRGDLSHETKILAQPLDDLIAFRVAHLHELIHDLAHQGRLPIVPDHELITHAITAAELVRDGGLDKLHYFGDEVHVRLYEHGRSLYGTDPPINDLDWLLEETRKVYLQVAEEGKLRKPAVAEDEAAEKPAEKEPELTPEMRRRQYFDFERLAGTMLGGYGAEREAKEHEDSLVYFTQYATDVLSRHDTAIAPMMQSEEGRRTAAQLQALLIDLARTITRDRKLQFEEIKDEDHRQELPEVRYLPAEHKIVAPESLWYLHEDVARGLIAQEIARALHARPDLIPKDLAQDSAFMELWYSTDSFRVVQEAYEQNPGLMGNVARYYDYRHTVINLESARRQMNQLPAHLQYLAGLVWEWNRKSIDPRISRTEVLAALTNTRTTLEILRTLKDPEAYLKKLQEDVWPVMRELREQAVNDGMMTEVMNDMVEQKELELSEEQQAWDQSGQLQLEDMNGEQEEAIEHKMDEEMTPEERRRLEEEIRKRLEEMTRLYREKQGGQALGDMRIKMAQQAGGPNQGASSRTFPMMPSRSPSGLAQKQKKSMTLAEALKALIKEAEALEKLAEQTQQTADQLAQNADGAAETKEPLELVKSLNEQAKALRDEAKKLREHAQQFEQAVQEARQGVPTDAQRVKGEAQSLADDARSFVEQTEKFEGGAEAFAKLGQGLEERVEQDASALTPLLAGAVKGNAQKLQQDSHSLHDHAGRIQQLTDSLAKAFEQMGKPGGKGKPQPGQAQEGQGKGQPQEEELQDITHEHVGAEEVTAAQLAQASDPNAAGRGYGSGRSTHVVETKLKPTQPPKFRPKTDFDPPEIEKKPKASDESPSGRKAQATAAEREKALQRLSHLMQNAWLGNQPARQRRRLSQLEDSPTERKHFYHTITKQQAPAIKRIRTEIMAAFQMTETGGKITGLPEGEYLDSDMLGHIRDNPPAVMAVDIAPEEYDVYISLLTDLSGSMLSPLPNFMPTPPPGVQDGSQRYREWLEEIYNNPDKAGMDLENTYLYQAAIAAAILREATKTHGVKSEEYGFNFNPAVHFRDYDDVLSSSDAERINFELFSHAGGGTNDTEAIAQAVRRMALRRMGRPGLRIIGIGLGAGTEKVRDAYFPNGYYVEDVSQLPDLIKKIVKDQLTGTKRVPNVIIVLTDGNPGANNNAFIQGLMSANQKSWDKRFTTPPKRKRSEVRAKPPFEYVWETQGGKNREFLVIQGHKLPTGKGGPLSPKIEIIPTAQLNLPPAPGGNDRFPAEYVARLELAEGAKSRSFMVALSPYNMKLLGQMMEILASSNKPNLYLRGPAAGGKNTLLYLLSALAKRPVHLMSLNYDTNERQLIALQVFGEAGKDETTLRPSPMVQAAMDTDGAWGAVDEVNKPANPGVLSALYSLAEQRFITMPDSSVVLAPADFRMIALGNPNRPPYVVSEVPVDFDRRFQFVDIPYLHSPKQKNETDEQMKERLAELAFLLRLQAPTLYAREKFYTYSDGGATKVVSGKYFIQQLILLAQDMVVAFEDGALPRPMSVRGLIRIARHLEHFPEDISDFQEVLGGAYNLRRISGDIEQMKKFEEFLENRLPGLSNSVGWLGRSIPLAGHGKKLASAVIERDAGGIKRKFYQIFEASEGNTSGDRILVEYPLPQKGKKNLPVGKLPELQSVLKKKLSLIKALLLGENVLIYAHSGTGKTSLVLDLLVNDLLAEPYQMQMNANTTVSALFGRQAIKDGKTVWEKTPLLLSLENNRPLLIDDIGKPKHQAVISVLNNALQFGQITTPYGVISGDAPVIATTTPEEVRYGVNPLSGEVEDRFKLLYFDWMSPEEEKEELEGLFPKISGNLISRLVDAVGELREKEEMKSEFMRPVTLQDMIVTLERFQRTDRELLDIFLSAYGIEPASDYAESIEKTFDERRFSNPTTGAKLASERHSDFSPAPKPEDILAAVGDDAKMNLLRRLISSFQGAAKKDSFRVQLNSAKPYGLTQAGRNPKGGTLYEVQVPQTMGPVGFTYQLKGDLRLSVMERMVIQRLYEALSKSPAVTHGAAPMLGLIKRALSNPDDDIISLTNLQGALRYLRLHGAQAVDLGEFKKILMWISGFELFSFPMRALAGKILAAVEGQTLADSIADLTKILPGDPAALRPVDPAYFERIKAIAKDLVPGFDKYFDSVNQAYYAAQSIKDRLASIGVYGNKPILFFDIGLSGTIASSNQEAYDRMHALLFSREVIRMTIRRSATAGYSYNEELAIMAEIDRMGWLNLPKQTRTEIFLLVSKIASEDSKLRHLEHFFGRMKKYSEKQDVNATWKEAAAELKGLPSYKSAKLNPPHVVTFRRSIRSLNADHSDSEIPMAGVVDLDEGVTPPPLIAPRQGNAGASVPQTKSDGSQDIDFVELPEPEDDRTEAEILRDAAKKRRSAGSGEAHSDTDSLLELESNAPSASVFDDDDESPIVLKSPAEEALASGQLPTKPVARAQRIIQLRDHIQNANFVRGTAVSKVARLIAFGTDYRIVGRTGVNPSRSGVGLSSTNSQKEFPVIYLWDLRKNQVLKVIEGFTRPIVSVAFDETGSQLAALDEQGNVYVWNIDSLKKISLGQARMIAPHPMLGIRKLAFVDATDLVSEPSGDYFPTFRSWFSGPAAKPVTKGPQQIAGFDNQNNLVWHLDVNQIPFANRSEVRQAFRIAERLNREQIQWDLSRWTTDPSGVLAVSRWGTEGILSPEWQTLLGPEAYDRFVAWSSGRSAPLWTIAAWQTDTEDLAVMDHAALAPMSTRTAALAPFGLSIVRVGKDYSDGDFMTTALLLTLPQNQYKLQAVITQGLKKDQIERWKFYADRYLDGRIVFIREESGGFTQTVENFFSGRFERAPDVAKFLSITRRFARQAQVSKPLTLDELRSYASVIGNRSEIIDSDTQTHKLTALRLLKEGETASLRSSASYRLDAVISLKTAGLTVITADVLDPETLRSLQTLETSPDGSLVRVVATPGLMEALSLLASSAASIAQAA